MGLAQVPACKALLQHCEMEEEVAVQQMEGQSKEGRAGRGNSYPICNLIIFYD